MLGNYFSPHKDNSGKKQKSLAFHREGGTQSAPSVTLLLKKIFPGLLEPFPSCTWSNARWKMYKLLPARFSFPGWTSSELPDLDHWTQLWFVKVRLSSSPLYCSRKITSLEDCIRNLHKCTIFKVAGHLLLKLNADSVRQASPYVKFGLRNIV